MAKYKRGDVVWVKFPYEENPARTKERPAILVEDEVDGKSLVVKCTKTDKSKYGPCIFIQPGTKEYKLMGLSFPTYISINEEIELSKYFILRLIGFCPETIMDKIDELKGN